MKNTTLQSTDEMNDLISKVRYYENPKALPKSKQEKYDRLNKAQFTLSYKCVLNQVRKEFLNIES